MAPHAGKSPPDQVNQNLWAFGFMKHLLATKTGTLPQLSKEEEVARLRHFVDVMEIAALHSTSSDFRCQGLGTLTTASRPTWTRALWGSSVLMGGS